MKRGVIAACALAVGVCSGPSRASTGDVPDVSRELALRRFQFQQLLDFQRARGADVVPPSPYDPLPRMQLTDAKTQFEWAGGKFVPVPPTHDRLLEQAIVRTFQQLLLPSACCPCVDASTCGDGFFCNGAEGCFGGNCASGPVACNDGNPCTTDACTENTDTCTFTPLPPPPAVAQLNLSRAAPASSVATLAWSGVVGASAYNVYRGSSRTLADLACLQTGVTGTSQNDDGAVPAGAFYYLVTSKACFESDLGSGNPSARPPAPGCP